MNNKYYVYGHFRSNNTIPFYIGKGCRGRMYDESNRSFEWWKIVIEENGKYDMKKIHTDLTEEEAFQLEKDEIKKYGRLNESTGGALVNTNSGGRDGGRGKNQVKSKRSKARTSKNIRAGLSQAMLEGKLTGRKSGTADSKEKFLAKPRSQRIKKYLIAGHSINATAKLASAAPMTVLKVKKLLSLGRRVPKKEILRDGLGRYSRYKRIFNIVDKKLKFLSMVIEA